MTTILKVSTRVLSMVRPVQGERDIRYYINGIHCEPNPAGGVIAVAMDGHRIAAALDPDGVCTQPITINLPKEGWGHCNPPTPNAAAPDKSTALVVSVDENAAPTDDFGDLICGPNLRGWSIDIRYDLGGLSGKRVWIAPESRPLVIEGKFPDWRKVLPKSCEGWAALLPCSSRLNVIYVEAIRKHIKSRKEYTGIRLWQMGSDKPVLVQFDSLPQLVVGIMPLRGDGAKWTGPEFLGGAT